VPDLTIPEPGNRGLVMWMRGGVPVAVYVRIDEFATLHDPESRWFNADHEQAGIEDHAWTWMALCRRLGLECDGPHPLHIGEPLGVDRG
jgi:hypothetical protein